MRTLLLALVCLCASSGRAQEIDILAGRPSFSQAQSMEYHVWHIGNQWHVRWSSLQRPRRFTGSVSVDSGSLAEFHKVDPVTEFDRLFPGQLKLPFVRVRPGERFNDLPRRTSPDSKIQMKGKQMITFISVASNSADGFDFTVDDDVQTLTIDLWIEGKPATGIVHLGKDNSSPESLPITVSLKR